MRWIPALGAAVAFAAGCGYPSFDFETGTGGMGGSPSTTGTGGTGGKTTATVPVCPDHVVVSEIRTRGLGGGADEFVELYNPTGKDIVLGPDWTIQARSPTDFVDSQRWQGAGGILPAHGYFLIAGSSYAESPAPDDALSEGITDAGRVSLVQSPDLFTNNVIDAVCYAYDATTLGLVEIVTCPGTPAQNPHDDTTASNADRSIKRTPRDCTDIGDNSVDFGPKAPATPKSSKSPTVTY